MSSLGGFPIRFVRWLVNDRLNASKLVNLTAKGKQAFSNLGKQIEQSV